VSGQIVNTDPSGSRDSGRRASSGFSVAVTSSQGFEREILRLRNANRDRAETSQYVNWRYQHLAGAPPPQVFWLLAPQGERIGMASVVFRPYWLNGARVQTAVVGDISLDVRWRGQGLGRLLLQEMTAYLDQHFPQHPGFVIPTEAARHALARAGWTAPGTLVPHVYVVDVTRYVGAIIRSAWLTALIARPLRWLARTLARLRAPRDAALILTDAPGEALQEFLRSVAPSEGAVHDLGAQTLRWRYQQHPNTHFVFATYTRGAEVRGFLVFEETSLEGVCHVYDLAARAPADMRAMLALLILRSLDTPGMITVRMLTDDRHPARRTLRALGFSARRADAVYQVYSRDGSAERCAWHVTQGDKDT
jgi:GNAT superfamily N-acetyltransferase